LNLLRDRARRNQLLKERKSTLDHGDQKPAQEDVITVHALLVSIPDELREIAVYYYLDQMNQNEIAEVLGMSRRTVGHRLEEFLALARSLMREPEVVSP
jgi:RNA polymerase sigma-70 factor (ECF subfamily)